MSSLTEIKTNIQSLKENIKVAAQKCGRNSDEISIIGVSKTMSVAQVTEAYNCGITMFGENRAQEYLVKQAALPQAQWHIVGHLQTNKVKSVIPTIGLLHSLDSFNLMKEIEKYADSRTTPVECLMQINISNEESKYGLDEKECEILLDTVKRFPRVHIRGLMGIASLTTDRDVIRREFRRLRIHFEHCKIYNDEQIEMKYLSMGMSSDFDIAISEGATHLRIGSAIFGEKGKKKKE